MSINIDKKTRDMINKLNKTENDIKKLKSLINKSLSKSSSIVATGSFGASQSIPTDYDNRDTKAFHSNIAAEFNALTEKTVIVDADLLLIEDSEDSNTKKKMQVSNIVDSLAAEIATVYDAGAIAAVEGEATLDLTGAVTIVGILTPNGNIVLIDSKEIKWGTGSDVAQYFDGTYMRWDCKGNSVWFKDMTTIFLDLRGVFYIRDDDDGNVILLSLNTSARTLAIGLSADPITTTHTGDFNITEGSLNIDDGITAPGTTSGKAKIYVDTADGDLKIKFGDGTVKTITTDT